MKCSLGISNYLEEIFSLSHSIVFLYFFATLRVRKIFVGKSVIKSLIQDSSFLRHLSESSSLTRKKKAVFHGLHVLEVLEEFRKDKLIEKIDLYCESPHYQF